MNKYTEQLISILIISHQEYFIGDSMAYSLFLLPSKTIKKKKKKKPNTKETTAADKTIPE